MKAIISREHESVPGYIPECGTDNRTLVSHYKTLNGMRRFAKRYAQGRAYRIEFFTDSNFYGDAFRTETGR
jgi:hypothetical protein